MGRRVSKSFKVAPGVRVRLNAKSTSVTVDGGAAHYTVNSKGRRTATVNAPGTGRSPQHQSSGQHRAQPRASAKLSAYQTAGNGNASLTPTDTPSHNRLARWGCITILVVLVVVAAIVTVIEIRTHEPPRLFPPIQEDLKLSGPLNGNFTTATTVEGVKVNSRHSRESTG